MVSCQKASEGNRLVVINDGFVTEDGIRILLDPVRADDTKAVKSGWENGDAILVFFSTIDSPRYLKMVYSTSTGWSYHPMSGATETAGALSFSNDSSGSLCAVYLPFLRNITAEAGSGGDKPVENFYLVDNTHGNLFTYYLTSIKTYTISAKTLSASLTMAIPEDFVQFYVKDAKDSSLVDEKYRLHTDAVLPSGIIGVKAAANEIITRDLNITNDMYGYVYSDGYIFSGRKNPDYFSAYEANNVTSFYFTLAKDKVSAYRKDLYVASKTLASKDAVLLPAEDNARWIEIGSNKTVTLGRDAKYGTWYTLNETDDPANFTTASAKATGSKKLMTKAQLDNLVAGEKNKEVTRTALSHYGTKGVVLSSSTGGQFVFLPLNSGGVGDYWCEEETGGTGNAHVLHLGQTDAISAGKLSKDHTCRVRLLN